MKYAKLSYFSHLCVTNLASVNTGVDFSNRNIRSV